MLRVVIQYVSTAIIAVLWIIGFTQSSALLAAEDSFRPEDRAVDNRNIEQRLSQIELSIANIANSNANSVDQVKYMNDLNNTKLKLENLQNKLHETSLSLSSTDLTLAGQYFQIFGLMIALAGVLGAFAVYIVQERVSSIVLKKAVAFSKKEVNKRVKYDAYLTLAESYAQLSYTWWEHYEPQFQSMQKNGRDDSGLIAREVLMTRRLADKGLDILKEANLEAKRVSDDRIWTTYVKLTNHWTYNKMAELTCSGQKKAIDDPEVHALLGGAEECLKLSRDKRADKIWYNLQDTAAQAMIRFGGEASQEDGRKIIRNYLQGKAPKGFEAPPKIWRKRRWEVHFPLKGEGLEREDIFKLGIIAEP